jgi:hypothetical protein
LVKAIFAVVSGVLLMQTKIFIISGFWLFMQLNKDNACRLY